MNYISEDEFLNQSSEVQEVFINWWNPSAGDLFYIDGINELQVVAKSTIDSFGDDDFVKFKKGCIPLLVEGQLRQFIEDTTGGKLEIYPYSIYDNCDFSFIIRDTGCCGDDPQLDISAENIFEAYWKASLKVANDYLEKEC